MPIVASTPLPTIDPPPPSSPLSFSSDTVISDNSLNQSLNCCPVPSLPDFCPLSSPSFIWGSLEGEECCKAIDDCYSEAAHWRHNLFRVPSGSAGKSIVSELSRLYLSFGESSSLESVALTAALLFPILMLQNPNKKQLYNNKQASNHVSRRLELWKSGSFLTLMEECRTIQNRLRIYQPSEQSTEALARAFSNLMIQGKTHAAIRLLSERTRGLPLSIDFPVSPEDSSLGTVFDHLIEKHPKCQPASTQVLLPHLTLDSNSEPHPIMYEGLDGQAIKSSVLNASGAAGPSGIDSTAMRRFCVSFGRTSDDLCNSMASVARRLCTTFVHPQAISSYLSCRLIALDKCPGVRPIGNGEISRRIISKSILRFLKGDIIDSVGPLQTCAGHTGGCEAAVHTIRKVFESSETEAVLLVDAKNAFNSLNRAVAIRNILSLCPAFAKIIVNTYRSDIKLYIINKLFM